MQPTVRRARRTADTRENVFRVNFLRSIAHLREGQMDSSAIMNSRHSP
jgi:hypothetical protein